MSEKDVKKLRREVEILKAQLTGKSSAKESSKLEKEDKRKSSKKEKQPAVVKESLTGDYVQKDLKRSLIITAGILTLIITLYISQPYWNTLVNF